jgi:hypothetical protein
MNKSLRLALTTAGVLLLLVYISLFVKLVTLGSTNYSHNLGPSFLPFGHIDNSRDGFSLASGPGSIAIPALAGMLVGAAHAIATRLRQSRR